MEERVCVAEPGRMVCTRAHGIVYIFYFGTKRNDPIVRYSVVEASGHREKEIGPRDEK